jgi:hypothetical protein
VALKVVSDDIADGHILAFQIILACFASS